MEAASDRSQDLPEGPSGRRYVYSQRGPWGTYRSERGTTCSPARGAIYITSWGSSLILEDDAEAGAQAPPAPDLRELSSELAAAQAEIEQLRARCAAYERLLEESGVRADATAPAKEY